MAHRFYHGLDHTFTNSSQKDQITIKAGKGESLLLDGNLRLPQTYSASEFAISSSLPFTKYVAQTTPFTTGVQQGQEIFVNQNYKTDPNSPYLLSVAFENSRSQEKTLNGQTVYPAPIEIYKKQLDPITLNPQLRLSACINTGDLTASTTSSCVPALFPSASLYNDTISINWNENDFGAFGSTAYTTLIYKQPAIDTYTLSQKFTTFQSRWSLAHKNYCIVGGGPSQAGRILYRPDENTNYSEIQTFSGLSDNIMADGCFLSNTRCAVVDTNVGNFYTLDLSPTGYTLVKTYTSSGPTYMVEYCAPLDIIVTVEFEIISYWTQSGLLLYQSEAFPYGVNQMRVSGTKVLVLYPPDVSMLTNTLKVYQLNASTRPILIYTKTGLTGLQSGADIDFDQGTDAIYYGDITDNPQAGYNQGCTFAGFVKNYYSTTPAYVETSVLSNDINGFKISTPALTIDNPNSTVSTSTSLIVHGNIQADSFSTNALTLTGDVYTPGKITAEGGFQIDFAGSSFTGPNATIGVVNSTNLFATNFSVTNFCNLTQASCTGLITTKTLTVSANPYGTVSNTATQSIVNNTNVTLTNSAWSTSATTLGSMSYSNGAFTVPSAGMYSVNIMASMSFNASTDFRLFRLIKSGTFINPNNPIPYGGTVINMSIVIPLVANDTLAVGVYQNSGTTLSANANGGQFTVYKIG